MTDAELVPSSAVSCTSTTDETAEQSSDVSPVEDAMPLRRAVCFGGGVIGAGWASRFVLNGVHTTVVDPDPQAERKVTAVLENARRAMEQLIPGFGRAMKGPGSLTVMSNSDPALHDALQAADYIQESLPENPNLKQKCYEQIERSAKRETVIASSTSGITPGELSQFLQHPERLVVTHPFNPVYLLPLVEIVGDAKTSVAARQFCVRVCESVGMWPMVLGEKAGETPGFVADRLLEALWREGLHLVNDGVATTSQVDDAIRFGPGLRFSFMGSFLTYYLAGGEGGMRHFMRQFGPALKLPWTKLEAPELSDELLDKVVAQSDIQFEQSVSEGEKPDLRLLERKRDACLVGVMQALKAEDFGAGRALQQYERRVLRNGRKNDPKSEISAPLVTKPGVLCKHQAVVKPEWLDYNGHMTEMRYHGYFSDATDCLLAEIGMCPVYVAKHKRSYYTVETHIIHKQEASAGDLLYVETQVLKMDEKRIQLWHEVKRDGELLATAEKMLLHVDMEKGKACANEDEAVLARVRELLEGGSVCGLPEGAGRFVGAPRVKA